MTILIRRASVSDASGIARVHVDAWRTTYKGIVPDAYLANLSYDDRERRWQSRLGNERNFVFVAEDENTKQILGFVSGGEVRSKDPEYLGELEAIYLLEGYRGKGLGQKLVRNLAKKLQEEGYNSMLVWVLAQNPYRRFYEKLGGKYVRSEQIEMGGAIFEEVAYGWKNLESFTRAAG
ncbi:MAG: GNAT family N-acetyltransferase [Nitrososphaerales archaeon]